MTEIREALVRKAEFGCSLCSCLYLERMRICYSHNTALHLLRLWSVSHAVALEHFHGLTPAETKHLPTRVLSLASSVQDCAHSLAGYKSALEQLENPALRRMLQQLLEQPELGSAVHLLVAPGLGQRNTKQIVFHQAPAELPRGSLLQLAPTVHCSSPELVFVQLSEQLELGEAVALGYELCGCYPVGGDSLLVRRQVTTPKKLVSFIGRLGNVHGIRKARLAAQFVQAKSASVMETELCALATMPMRWGGYGLPSARLNEKISLSRAAATIARSPYLTLDMYWPEGPVALEYDGKASHSGEGARARDSRRRDALAAEGIPLATLTSKQMAVVGELEEIVAFVGGVLGRRARAKTPEFRERHSRLRAQLKRFHNGVWWS